ncbi:MAG: hypothetical protein ACT4OS_01585 [Acidimicrobiales bacterium]
MTDEANGSTNGHANGGVPPVDPGPTPAVIVERFVDAIAWGEHRTVWELFGSQARNTVLKVAGLRGMDDDLVARLRDSTASADEYNEFLADLVLGLRADLAGNDLDSLQYETDEVAPGPGQARVVLNVPLAPTLGGVLPMGSVELEVEDGSWKVVRVVPQVTK